MPKSLLKSDKPAPLVLIFSRRERIRSILTAGLLQCNYRVVDADSPYLAAIKASQFLPDIVIADITKSSSKDFLLISRMRRSLRTRNLVILVTVPAGLRYPDENLKAGSTGEQDSGKISGIHFLEFPFVFADMLKKIEVLLGRTAQGSAKSAVLSVSGNEKIAAELFDLQISVQKKLQDIESLLHRQWAFPFTVVKALNIMESNSSCGDELAHCIEGDPGAASAVLKVANTVYYAGREKKISSLRDAVVRLGFRETRNLLACMALIDLSAENNKSSGFTRNEFWLHSLATAMMAERLCRECGHLRPELGFISGLLHDLGKVPMDMHFPAVFSSLLEETANSVSAFYDTEERKIGFSHAALCHYLLNLWNFPSGIPLSILHHHWAANILETKTPADRVLQSAVFAGNIFAKALNFGHSCDEILEDIPQVMLNELQIPQGPAESFFLSVLNDIQTFCRYLDLAPKNLAVVKDRDEAGNAEIAVTLGPKLQYHPVIAALRNNGFALRFGAPLNAETAGMAKIVVHIPDPGVPPDILLDPDPVPGQEKKLRIYLLDSPPKKNADPEPEDPSLIFMSRRNLDMRLLLYFIDRFPESGSGPGPVHKAEPS